MIQNKLPRVDQGPEGIGKGGAAVRNVLAMFGEGDGPEAFIPLKGGGVPVNIKGLGGSSPNVNFRGGDLHVHGNVSDDTLPKVRAMLAESQKQMQTALQRKHNHA